MWRRREFGYRRRRLRVEWAKVCTCSVLCYDLLVACRGAFPTG